MNKPLDDVKLDDLARKRLISRSNKKSIIIACEEAEEEK